MQQAKQTPTTNNSFATEGFSVADILAERAIAMRKRRKRVRTRAALVAAAAQVLERRGFESLTVEGITEAAGMVRGTFYLYYKSRSEITATVMRFYGALVRIHRPRGGAKLDLHDSIHRMNSFSAHLAMKNARLLSGREALMLENPAIAGRLEALNRAWADRIVQDVMTRGSFVSDDESLEFLHLKARAIITMSDALLRDIYRNPQGADQTPAINLDLVVRVMDDLWFRSLYMKLVA